MSEEAIQTVTISRARYRGLWGLVALLVVLFAAHHYLLVYLPEQALLASTGGPEGTKDILVPVETKLTSGPDLLRKLRAGGYVLYLRHFQSDHSKWHVDPIKRHHGEMALEDFRDCSQQRPLTDWGRARARHVGEILRGHGIPVGTIRASPYCRVTDGVQAMFQRPPDELHRELIFRGGSYTREQMARAMIPHLSRIPAPGTNDVVMAHKPNVEDIGIPAEGEMFVFEPRGEGKFAFVARILDSEWFEATVDEAFLGAAAATGGAYE